MSKYFTFSLDDGVTQDEKIIGIFKKYGFHGCTFFINTGLLGANWDHVGALYGKPGVTHIRFSEEELRGGVYDGFDVAVHTLHHPALKDYDGEPEKITHEINGDAENIKRIFGAAPVGMSYPYGEDAVTEKTIKTILETTDIRYSRGVRPTYGFDIPDDFTVWLPTCSLTDDKTIGLAEKFVKLDPKDDSLFYVWCHGYELDMFDTYGRLEDLIKLMTGAKDIICADNTEFYRLFAERNKK